MQYKAYTIKVQEFYYTRRNESFQEQNEEMINNFWRIRRPLMLLKDSAENRGVDLAVLQEEFVF